MVFKENVGSPRATCEHSGRKVVCALPPLGQGRKYGQEGKEHRIVAHERMTINHHGKPTNIYNSSVGLGEQ